MAISDATTRHIEIWPELKSNQATKSGFCWGFFFMSSSVCPRYRLRPPPSPFFPLSFPLLFVFAPPPPPLVPSPSVFMHCPHSWGLQVLGFRTMYWSCRLFYRPCSPCSFFIPYVQVGPAVACSDVFDSLAFLPSLWFPPLFLPSPLFFVLRI